MLLSPPERYRNYKVHPPQDLSGARRVREMEMFHKEDTKYHSPITNYWIELLVMQVSRNMNP